MSLFDHVVAEIMEGSDDCEMGIIFRRTDGDVLTPQDVMDAVRKLFLKQGWEILAPSFEEMDS